MGRERRAGREGVRKRKEQGGEKEGGVKIPTIKGNTRGRALW